MSKMFCKCIQSRYYEQDSIHIPMHCRIFDQTKIDCENSNFLPWNLELLMFQYMMLHPECESQKLRSNRHWLKLPKLPTRYTEEAPWVGDWKKVGMEEFVEVVATWEVAVESGEVQMAMEEGTVEAEGTVANNNPHRPTCCPNS